MVGAPAKVNTPGIGCVISCAWRSWRIARSVTPTSAACLRVKAACCRAPSAGHSLPGVAAAHEGGVPIARRCPNHSNQPSAFTSHCRRRNPRLSPVASGGARRDCRVWGTVLAVRGDCRVWRRPPRWRSARLSHVGDGVGSEGRLSRVARPPRWRSARLSRVRDGVGGEGRLFGLPARRTARRPARHGRIRYGVGERAARNFRR